MTDLKRERTYVSNPTSLPLAGVVGAVATGVTVALLDIVLEETTEGEPLRRRIDPDDVEIVPAWHGRDHQRRWMTIPEAAEYARTDVGAMRDAIAAGDVTPRQANPECPVVVDSAEVDAWILHQWMNGEFSIN